MGVLDAWVYGIPCVVTTVGGLPDVIEEGKNCLTFPFDDVDALTMQLRKLMESPDLRRNMAEYSKSFGERVFAPVMVNESIEKLYEEIFKAVILIFKYQI